MTECINPIYKGLAYWGNFYLLGLWHTTRW